MNMNFTTLRKSHLLLLLPRPPATHHRTKDLSELVHAFEFTNSLLN
jgi:hypothetical protein